jgi:hypothetical protein
MRGNPISSLLDPASNRHFSFYAILLQFRDRLRPAYLADPCVWPLWQTIGATNKINPGDFDFCYDSSGVDRALLGEVLERPEIHGATIKQVYGGDIKVFTPGNWKHNPLAFFQNDSRIPGGQKKGIISLDLGELQ